MLGSKDVYDPLESTATDLYPVWNTYVLRFVFDDRAYILQGLKEGEAIAYPEEPTKEGYVFVGWCTADDTVCSPLNMPGKSSIFYPKWEDIAPLKARHMVLVFSLSVGVPVFVIAVAVIIALVVVFKKKGRNAPNPEIDRPRMDGGF